MKHILFLIGLAATSAVFALLEIQIEGGEGWAGKLPTWRIQNRWTRLLFGARPVTGYHFYFWLFLVLLAHLPCWLSFTPFSLAAEARIVAFIFLFWITEDFLWFVFNPAYGLRRFRREAIWWHRDSWWVFMPRDYWTFGLAGIALYILSWRL